MDTELTFTPEPVCSMLLSIITKSTRYYPTTIRKQVITRNIPISSVFVRDAPPLPSREYFPRKSVPNRNFENFQNIEISKNVVRRHDECRMIMAVISRSSGGSGIDSVLDFSENNISETVWVMVVKGDWLFGYFTEPTCLTGILALSRVVQMGFLNIPLTLSVRISELRGSYQKVSPEMNVSRRVDYRSTKVFCLTPSHEKVTITQRR